MILEHLLVNVTDYSELMDIYLNFVLEIFEAAKDGDAVSDLYVLVVEPSTKVTLATRLTSLVVKVIKPEDACHHTC